MTGYGRGRAARDGWRAIVEIRSVNHRYIDVKLRGSSLDPTIEERLMTALRARVERGALAVTVRVEGGEGGSSVRVDLDAARRVQKELADLADALGVESRPGLELICAQPGVLVPTDNNVGIDSLGACLEEALDQALDALLAMRDTEGAALARDLEARLDHLASLVDEISERVESAPEEAQRRLEERVGKLLQNSKVELDPARLAQEVAILADRHDITEELVRLRSHLEQARSLMTGGDPSSTSSVGRRLGFLVQELGRELNTVAAKSQSSEIAHAIVEAKAELEKLREQVQNIE